MANSEHGFCQRKLNWFFRVRNESIHCIWHTDSYTCRFNCILDKSISSSFVHFFTFVTIEFWGKNRYKQIQTAKNAMIFRRISIKEQKQKIIKKCKLFLRSTFEQMWQQICVNNCFPILIKRRKKRRNKYLMFGFVWHSIVHRTMRKYSFKHFQFVSNAASTFYCSIWHFFFQFLRIRVGFVVTNEICREFQTFCFRFVVTGSCLCRGKRENIVRVYLAWNQQKWYKSCKKCWPYVTNFTFWFGKKCENFLFHLYFRWKDFRQSRKKVVDRIKNLRKVSLPIAFKWCRFSTVFVTSKSLHSA